MALDPWICQSVCLAAKLRLTVKAVKASINVSNVSYKCCTFVWYTKKEKYLHEVYMFTFIIFFPQAYLIWALKLDVPKIGILLSKRILNTPWQFDCAEPNTGQVVIIKMWSKMLPVNQIRCLGSVLFPKLIY